MGQNSKAFVISASIITWQEVSKMRLKSKANVVSAQIRRKNDETQFDSNPDSRPAATGQNSSRKQPETHTTNPQLGLYPGGKQ
jgi:hypothetical protein